jgi:hypothetical protein
MSTITDSLVGAISYSPVSSSVIGFAIGLYIGIIMGGLLATVLWFRWYINGSLEAMSELANGEQ